MAKADLKTRVITGVLGGVLLLGVLVAGGLGGVAFLAWVVSTVLFYEFSTFLIEKSEHKKKKQYFFYTLIFMIHALSFLHPDQIFSGMILGFFLILAFYLWTFIGFEKGSEEKLASHVRELLGMGFGWVYLAITPLYLVMIRREDSGLQWLLLFLLMVWATDTGAYFAGRTFGRRKLCEKVSPKKTVEGLIGGILTAWLISQGFIWTSFGSQAPHFLIFLGLSTAISLISQVGDLCESLIKRALSIKDFGSVLPGHGGFMDRFDGVVFAIPFMYTFIRILHP